MPSLKPGNGTSAFVLSVALRNEIGEPLDVTYVESVKAAYKQAFSQWDADRDLLHASGNVVKEPAQVRCDFHVPEPRSLLFSRKGRMSRFEGSPPSLFMRVPAVNRAAVTPTAEKDAEGADWIGMRVASALAPSQERVFHCIVGYAYSQAEIDRIDQRWLGKLALRADRTFKMRGIVRFQSSPTSQMGHCAARCDGTRGCWSR